ncbi:hypothetical protein Fcan01_18211 [Folsomia candida]|uniref:DDE Tnp4 domain-containing protein n=1 Tax=Folsomia candida TaxID=158441 RepID=A0A226DNV0_FOLCA|nr:hypothetical protein Fcan01_18211 [Folsomia candida]
MRPISEQQMWTVLPNAMLKVGKTARLDHLICSGCHGFIRGRLRRGLNVDLQVRLNQVETSRSRNFQSRHHVEEGIQDQNDEDMPNTSSDHEVPHDEELSQAMVIDAQVPEDSFEQDVRQIQQHDPVVEMPGIPSASSNENRCLICKTSVRTRIKRRAIIEVFLRRGILIPENNRCCKDHLEDEILKPEDMDAIEVEKPYSTLTGKQVAKWLTTLRKLATEKKLPIDFSKNSSLTNSDYEMLLGVSMASFEILLKHCEGPLRNSPNRTIRSALAMFLMKLRLNISQRVLAFLFGIKNQSTVSESISAVLDALMSTFVPLHSGYNHITREDLHEKHMRRFYTEILGVPPESLILILDGTYIFTQKASDFKLQRRSYSSHKKRNLFKPMMVVCPDGYIVEATGLFYGDCGNNDANILKKMLEEHESIMVILEDGDVLILDRGFRDAIEEAESQGLSVLVTMLRWVVESANGRLKNKFRFFDNTIAASCFPKLPGFLKVAVSILNAFSPPLFTESDWNEQLVELVSSRLETENSVQMLVEEKNLQRKNALWKNADEDCVLEFPQLSMEELKNITLGPYQIKIGALYNNQHAPSGSGYEFFFHEEMADLVRAKLQSRFCKRGHHTLWIKFIPWGRGPEAIVGWYCLCKNGARTLGCCGHVAAVLRYLALDRFVPPAHRRQLDLQGYIDATPIQQVPSSSQPGPSQRALVEDIVQLVDDSSDEEELSNFEELLDI